MLYRKIQNKIEEWIINGRDALLITGARQVGKSYIIRETLRRKNIDFVEINLIKEPKLLQVFLSTIDEGAEHFRLALSVATRHSLSKDTVVFFDEIQECKEIVSLIKFLVEEGECRFILSGSLLGVELVDLRSAPVGYLTTLDMYPMDLEEFFLSNGLSKEVISSLRECYDQRKPVNEFIHNSLIDGIRQYLIVGGMPEAVQTFIDTKDYNSVSSIHQKIIREYKRDFTKYEKEQKLKLINTYELIPVELNQKNKRYTFKKLNNELRFDRYENSFNWLNNAGVSLPTYNVTELEIPLKASEKSNLFKLFLSDVGLLTTMYGKSTVLNILDKSESLNFGSLYENLVAEELISHGFKLFYFHNKKHGEIDFLIEDKGRIIPLEVKSGKDYQIHSALSFFINNNEFNEGVVLSNYNVKVKDRIVYYPIYMTMFFTNDITIQKTSSFDLSKLKSS